MFDFFFKQSMFHEDALSRNLGIEGLLGMGSATRFATHSSLLSSRPDYDGVMSYRDLSECIILEKVYRMMNVRILLNVVFTKVNECNDRF